MVHANPSTYGMAIYGSSTYAFAVPSVPPAKYGLNVYGDINTGYA
jgi:hypothetical protein